MDGANKAIKEIDDFIKNAKGLNMGKINKLNASSKKLNNSTIDEKVKEALQRIEEVKEMFNKRENR